VGFNAKRFMTLAGRSCASAARTFGFRSWRSRAGNSYSNPFPEVYATAETVRQLKAEGFRVMPEVVVREVLRKGRGGRGSHGKRGSGGRFDITVWNANGTPAAALELKWKWNSVAADIARLNLAHRRIQIRTFVAVLAAENTRAATRKLLKKRIGDLKKHGADPGDPVCGRIVKCWDYEAGLAAKEPRFFGTAVVEIIPRAKPKRKPSAVRRPTPALRRAA
jgi:hypothetical protein